MKQTNGYVLTDEDANHMKVYCKELAREYAKMIEERKAEIPKSFIDDMRLLRLAGISFSSSEQWALMGRSVDRFWDSKE